MTDRYPLPIRIIIYGFVTIFSAPIALWIAVKRIGERDRIK